MNWLSQVPIGQFVSGNNSWLVRHDPRLKFVWVLMFLLTPVLAGSVWRLGLVIALFVITFVSEMPKRVWLRSFVLAFVFAIIVGLFSLFLPTGEVSATLNIRNISELPGATLEIKPWEIFKVGPLDFGPFSLGLWIISRESVELAVKTSTLIFTVVHSVNLMLLTTPPEELVWALGWFMRPLGLFGIAVDRLSFQMLLALRFIPLVQEELQNLIRSVSIRAVDIRKLGFKTFFGLVLSIGERLLANILLRAEQGAEAFVVRGGRLLPPDQMRPKPISPKRTLWAHFLSGSLLLFVLSLRGKYGDL